MGSGTVSLAEGSLDHFPMGEADLGVQGSEGFLLHFAPGRVGPSAIFSGDDSGVSSSRLNPRSGVEPRLEVPASAEGILGVRDLLLSSLPLPCIPAVEGRSSSSELDDWSLG